MQIWTIELAHFSKYSKHYQHIPHQVESFRGPTLKKRFYVFHIISDGYERLFINIANRHHSCLLMCLPFYSYHEKKYEIKIPVIKQKILISLNHPPCMAIR